MIPHEHIVFAAAGGGSAGFGGGGGFHGGGGGKAFALYFIFRLLLDLLIWGHGIGALIVVGLILAFIAFNYLGPKAQRMYDSQRSTGRATRRKVAQRERRVELAAAEAAEDDDAFSPEVVRAQATALFKQVQAAWDRADRQRLGYLVAPSLMNEWDRRLDDFDRKGWRNHVRIVGEPQIEYVGLSHKGDASRDRVVVRVEAKLHDYVVDRYGNHVKRAGALTENVNVREFWTLVRQGDRWILGSIEQGAEGAHVLSEDLVATPWSDDQAMRDEALIEGAVSDAVPNGTKIAEVADLQFDGSARAAALDLSLADGRFAPDVLEVAARRAVAAWADAVDGSDRQLLECAEPEAARELLHPAGPASRLVVRGPKVSQIRIEALDAATEPPTMTIDVEIKGRRYLEDRSTAAVIAGSQSRETTFTERWTLALDGDQSQPWRIVAADASASPV